MTTTEPPAPPADDFMRYDLLTQKALRGVVRDVLARVAREGAPGEHHFYISFRTTDPDVKLSSRLRERYPAEMTIVLQHQFWDLIVSDIGFEVGLSFGGVPEKLVVPFDSVTGFFDPSVQFGLKFDNPDEIEATDEDAEPDAAEDAPAALVAATEEAPAEGGAQVVSLDKFRKK
ncbi:SspB family protein [Methylopila musalis]|uniref:SspB family protein n=1 Tax=Methylopila musalis TaxID=1134781 RepID=A0ABW3Z6T6_9HYPH